MIVLLGVTIVTSFRSRSEDEPEDEFITILKQRYATEVREIVRIGEIKSAIRAMMLKAQTGRQENNDEAPKFVSVHELTVALRGQGLKDDERMIEEAKRLLVNEGIIYQHDYSNMWLVPSEDELRRSIDLFSDYAIFVTAIRDDKHTDHESGWINGQKFEDIATLLESRLKVPRYVLYEYAIPRIIKHLENAYSRYIVECHTFSRDPKTSICIYILKYNQLTKLPVSVTVEGVQSYIYDGRLVRISSDPQHVIFSEVITLGPHYKIAGVSELEQEISQIILKNLRIH